jgi:hypothetical protein
MQTTLVLFFNGGDFEAAARVCDASGQLENCYNSLGRDAAAYTQRDPVRGSEHCAHGTPPGRAHCIRGFATESVLNYASPDAGLRVCQALPDLDKGPCYDAVGTQGRTMLDPAGMAALCARAETGYEDDCRRGAKLEG